MVGDPGLAPVLLVTHPEHDHRLRPQHPGPAAQRLGRPLPGQAQQQGNLHAGGLAGRGGLHRRGIFVAVDEHQAGRPGEISQRGHRCQQHGTVRAVDQREAPAGQGRRDPVIDRGHHVHQRAFVQETKAAAPRNRRRHHHIGSQLSAPPQGWQQAGLPQGRGRLRLPTCPARPVKANPDQVNAR
jgi:hypothetical protein